VVSVQGGRIVEVGRRGPPDARDLGNVAILPGLVNAHTHLEFSGLAAPLGAPGMGMVDWIDRVIQYRREGSGFGVQGSGVLRGAGGAGRELAPHAPLAPRPSPPAAILAAGLRESALAGVTTLGEIAQPGWPPDVFQAASVRCVVFQELIAPAAVRVAGQIEAARRHVEAARPAARWIAGLSPHAPYTVHARLLSAAVALSAERKVPLAMHLAEWREELELLRTGGGPLRRFLERIGAWDPTAFSVGTRPGDYLASLAGAERVLVVHGNYLAQDEIALVGRQAERMAVVYCPRTHAYFRHDQYPLEKLLAAGARVCLGTDSRASSPDLSLLAEMRHVARHHPQLPKAQILRMGTLSGAEALGLAAETGSLEPGKAADLFVLSLPARNAADPHELLFAE
jgi:cytosine/adenosine deaminase-related metal-dependent hydrolase